MNFMLDRADYFVIPACAGIIIKQKQKEMYSAKRSRDE